MTDTHINSINTIDLKKRKTLASIAGVAAGGMLAGTSMLAGAASHTAPIDLEVTLISIPGPDFKWETLRLVNRTNRDIIIEQFHANKLVFDGEVVNCNDACAKGAIRLPVNDDRLVQFEHATSNVFETLAGKFLDVDKRIERLPAGTRVIRLNAHMEGNAAVLTQPDMDNAA